MLGKDKNKKTKSKMFLKYFKEHKKITISLIVCLGFLVCFLTINYGRYVKNIIEMYYLRSQNFYFSSDKLTINGKYYEIEPWEGKSAHQINITMSGLHNSLKWTTVDINYNVSCEVEGPISCSIGDEGPTAARTIYAADEFEHTDSFNVIVSPTAEDELIEGDRVTVHVKAVSTDPYVEELTATFTLIIGNYGVNYQIEDEKGRVYFDSIITNKREKDEARVTLTITNPDEIAFDMTNPVLDQEGIETVTIDGSDGNQYIYKVTFVVEPESSMMVRYFKKNANADYSYVVSEEQVEPVVSFYTPKIE